MRNLLWERHKARPIEPAYDVRDAHRQPTCWAPGAAYSPSSTRFTIRSTLRLVAGALSSGIVSPQHPGSLWQTGLAALWR